MDAHTQLVPPYLYCSPGVSTTSVWSRGVGKASVAMTGTQINIDEGVYQAFEWYLSKFDMREDREFSCARQKFAEQILH